MPLHTLRSLAALGALSLTVLAVVAKPPLKPPQPASAWRPDHIVIVVLENLSAHHATPAQRESGDAPVYGPSTWRFVNELARDGARFSNAHFGRTPYGSDLPTRPSQPNYLMLFSGHHQGVLPAWFEDERSPYSGVAMRNTQGKLLSPPTRGRVGVANSQVPEAWLPFASPNLGATILQGGGSFATFSESLPYPSWNCATDDVDVPCTDSRAATHFYRRKHNPGINWTDVINPTSERGFKGDLARHVMPLGVNLAMVPTRDPVLKQSFRGFTQDARGRPLPFDQLPQVAVVIPNEQNDGHSHGGQVADEWLRRNLGAYAAWAKAHNSLLVITFDEDGSTDGSRGDAYMTGAHPVPTVFYGARIRPGVYDQRIDHLNVLATVLWLNGALDRFRDDFRQFHRVIEGSGSEAEKAWLNLVPITSVFDNRPSPPPKPRRGPLGK